MAPLVPAVPVSSNDLTDGATIQQPPRIQESKLSKRSKQKFIANISSSRRKRTINSKKTRYPGRKERSTLAPISESDQQQDITTTENNVFTDIVGSSSADNPLAAAASMPSLYNTGLGFSPYGSMMPPSPFMGMDLPYLSGLNQMVYSIQSIVFSISQAIHMVGTNQQVLQHAWESLNKMVDNAVLTFHEIRAAERSIEANESEEERNRRKRLKALRYAFVFGGSWLAYKLVRHFLFKTSSRSRYPMIQPPNFHAMSNYSSPSNNNNNIYRSMGRQQQPMYPSNHNHLDLDRYY